MIDLSLGEFRALAAKALRGAGYSWGLADDGAFAAKRLAEYGLPSGAMLARLLHLADRHEASELTPDASWRASGTAVLCPVRLGCALADAGGWDHLDLGATMEPYFLGPLLIASLGGDEAKAYRVEWDGGGYAIGAVGLASSGSLPMSAVPITIERCEMPTSTPAIAASRVVLAPSVLNELERFAHRTYAPSTEASRATGAGAGLVDSD